MNADHLDTAGRAKTRHYQKLASELKKFSENVGETRNLFTKLEADLLSMRTLAGLHAAQFMAFTRMEDGVNESKNKPVNQKS
ncbi:hypothetical protein JB92DRAFT_3147452 [Gautieria morchelliformis]|nr:hypothetical protein JB92DRAFT_3147452 [Gautieria morchelliformis]